MIENATPPPVPREDNLAADLIAIVKPLPLTPELQNVLLEQLTVYIVERDHKILMHGIDTGRANA
jgi:hypothetical protein